MSTASEEWLESDAQEVECNGEGVHILSVISRIYYMFTRLLYLEVEELQYVFMLRVALLHLKKPARGRGQNARLSCWARRLAAAHANHREGLVGYQGRL